MPQTHGGEYAPLQPPESRLSSVAFGDLLEAVRKMRGVGCIGKQVGFCNVADSAVNVTMAEIKEGVGDGAAICGFERAGDFGAGDQQ